MLILVVNCGSSSIKYNLFDTDEKEPVVLSKGVVERIGETSSLLIHEVPGRGGLKKKIICLNHHKAMEKIRDVLTDPKEGLLSNIKDVMGVGHRVVHGGEEFNQSTLINKSVLKSIEKFSALAPLHNPPSLEGIKSCMKIFKDVPQIAVFDTAFHQSMPQSAFVYGIPYDLYKKYGIRRYGFHGTSHRYVSEKAAEILGRPVDKLNLITVHLGNGCSIAAVSKGKSVDTSMGFTPLEGLVMGTRSGDIDPAIVTFLIERKGLNAGQVDGLLNKQSGLLGISGVSNDMRDLLKAVESGNEKAKLAYDVFVYRIKKYIGSYSAVLGKVDAIIFTAGIGENVPEIRKSIEKQLKPLLGNFVKFLMVKTNEELLIAKDTYRIVKGR